MDAEWEERKHTSVARKQEVREAGRRKAGVAGAMMAGIMVTLHEIYEGPLPEELTIVADADGTPGDIDEDGVDFEVEDNQVRSTPPTRPPTGPPTELLADPPKE